MVDEEKITQNEMTGEETPAEPVEGGEVQESVQQEPKEKTDQNTSSERILTAMM